MNNAMLYIDDIRETPRGFNRTYGFDDTIELIMAYGLPSYISFDHDLGFNSKSGFDIAKWIIEYDLDNEIMDDGFRFNVHSANPTGADNIEKLLKNYYKFKFGIQYPIDNVRKEY